MVETRSATGYVGESMDRREDGRLLSGHGRFVADMVDRSTLHAAVVRSSSAAARVRSVQADEARMLPGVVGVFTGAQLTEHLGPLTELHRPDPTFAREFQFWSSSVPIPVCATSRVLYVGEPLAIVVAETRAIAEDGAELVNVDYDPVSPVTSASEALRDGAPKVHDGSGRGNLAAELHAEFGDMESARSTAAVVVDDTYSVGRHGALPIECRGVVAEWDARERRVHVWTSTQVPHLVRDAICSSTGWSPLEVRVAVPDVGGGFGCKANVYPEEILIPYLAKSLGRRLAWIEDRSEHLVATAQGRDQTLQASLMVSADGLLLGLEVDYLVDIGANSLWTAGIIANTALHLMGPYRLPAYRVTGRAVYTNKTVVAQYRGAGRPEACFALERSLDQAADRLGIDRTEIRRRNLLTGEDLPYARPLPYRDGVYIRYDGGSYLRCLEAVVEALPPSAVEEMRNRHPELSVGWGIADYLEATGRGPNEAARLRLMPDGKLELGTGAASAGQAHETTLVQVAADAVGVDLRNIVWHPSDTDWIPEGIGTFASRSAVVAGNATHEAGRQLRTRAVRLAARVLRADPQAVTVSGDGLSFGDRAISWKELAHAAELGGECVDEEGFDVHVVFSPDTVTWTMGAHAAIVGVDENTGIIRVLRYAVAHEGGVEINPMVVEGQIRGGVAQGIGGALLECFAYDGNGQPLSATLAEYLIPESSDVPRVGVVALQTKAASNPLGVKGVGESGTIAVYATLASAIEDALPTRRGALKSTPITPSEVVGILPDDEPQPGTAGTEVHPYTPGIRRVLSA